VLLTSVIRAHLEEFVPGASRRSVLAVRLTRDSELAVDEEDRQEPAPGVALGLTTRHFGQAIRLEV